MKKNLFLLLFFTSISGFCQVNFKWDKIDTISKTQSQIYAKTKMFIAEKWNSAQKVIQNDDKENGMILIKGKSNKTCTFMMNPHDFVFDYTVKFLIKDGKYRIIIEDVINTSHIARETYEWKPILVTDNYEGDMNLSKKRGDEILSALKTELQNIVDSYDIYLRKIEVDNSNW